MPETVANPTIGQQVGGRPKSTTSNRHSPHELQALERLTTGQLRTEWRQRYRSQAPRLSRDLLIRGIAHRLQEAAYGGMSKATHRKLVAFAQQLETNGHLIPPSSQQLKPGARLVREWRGRTYSVVVLEGGFEFEGEVYASLTRIAQNITGAHWSGPRFFGLINKKTSQGHLGESVDGGSDV